MAELQIKKLQRLLKRSEEGLKIAEDRIKSEDESYISIFEFGLYYGVSELLKELIEEIKKIKNVININQNVKVKITNEGINILSVLEEGGTPVPEIVDGYIEIQLWKLIALFGRYIEEGYEPIDYNIYFRQEDLYE